MKSVQRPPDYCLLVSVTPLGRVGLQGAGKCDGVPYANLVHRTNSHNQLVLYISVQKMCFHIT